MKKKLTFFVFLCVTLFSFATDWSKVNLPQSPLKDFTFLKVDDNTCYAFAIKVTGPSYSQLYTPYVYKTTNGGTSWDSIPQTGLNLGSDVKEAFIAETTLYVLSSNGLYKSIDNGLTWTVAASDYTGIYAPTDVSFDGTTIYVSVWNGLYATTNHFSTLNNINYNLKISTINYQFMCAEKLNGTLFGCINSKVYYLSESTWVLCTGIPDRQSNFTGLAYENGHYYVSDRSNNGYYLYHSTDGKAWTSLEQSVFSDVAYSGNLLYATKVAGGTYRRSTVSVNNNVFTNLTSDLPTLPVTNGLVVLGSRLFTGLVGNTIEEAGLYVREIGGGTGISTLKSTNKLTVWPNPAIDLLNLSSDYTGHEYAIMTMLGQTVSKGTIMGQCISVENMKKGMYIISITSKNGEKSSTVFYKL